MRKTKSRIALMCLSVAAILGCVGCSDSSRVIVSPTRTYAVAGTGNWYIQNIYALEKTDHTLYMSIVNGKSYSESNYVSTGITVYSPNNTGSTYSSSSLRVSSNSFYIDFTNANKPRTPVTGTDEVMVDTKYSFDVLTSSGTNVFYERFESSDPLSNDPLTQRYYGYGISAKTLKPDTATDGESARVDPKYYGKRNLNLSDGSYTIKITREYTWVKNTTNDKAIYTSKSTMTVPLLVDGKAPTIKMVDTNSKTIANGGYANKNVTVTATDDNLSGLYYKAPGSSSYSYASSGKYTTSGVNGWYYFYAKDVIDSESAVHSFYLDTSKPTGYVTCGGTKVANGAYISGSFIYNAYDNGSGIYKMYCKSPVSGNYVEYTSGSIIPSSSGDGWYCFYSVDKAGNVSDTTKVYLETSEPLVNIYRNGSVAFSVSMSNGGRYDTGIYFNRNDAMKITCDTSSGNVTSNYELNKSITLDGKYAGNTIEITVTTATGIKSTFVCHIINEKPYIYVNGNRYESGATLFLNEDAEVEFHADPVQGKDESTGVTINGEYKPYSELFDTTLASNDGESTTYNISLNDKAGNVSEFVIVIDKEAPKAVWNDIDGNRLPNDSYTSKNVSLVLEEDGLAAVCSHNGGEYGDYQSGTALSEEGNYSIVVTDLAGNKMTYSVTIDRTAPVGRLYSDYKEIDNGSITSGKVCFTWDEDCTATVNGSFYQKNSVISSEGVYDFVLTDKAGNETSYRVEIDLTAPSKNKDEISKRHSNVVSKWYNVVFDGSKTSFATYQEALDYACTLESDKYVTALYLDDVSKFTQTHLIASGEVHTGTYYRYKSVSSASNELYYFDEEGLKAAVESYAKAYVSDVNYFNLDGNDIGDIGSDSMYCDVWNHNDGSSPIINGYCFSMEDSNGIYARLKGESDWTEVLIGVPFEEQFHATGLYEIREVDLAGNESVYEVFLDLSSPELSVRAEVFGEAGSKDLVISKGGVSEISAYYYKSFSISSILDNDPYAVVSVTKNGEKRFYSAGDELPTLDQGGRYDVSVYDRLGNSYSFTVYIVGNEADVSFKNNKDDTAFDVDISLEQDFDAIVSLDIYRDGKKLDGVSPERTHYEFTKGGTYRVVIKDNFGRTIEKTYEFKKALPGGSLSCQDGSKTKEDVSFTYDSSKCYAEIYKDGSLIETDRDGEITCSQDGSYSVKLINLTDDDNFRVYRFEIDKTAPDVKLGGVADGGRTNGDVTVSWDDKDVVSATYSLNGGTESSFENGFVFAKEGTYVVTIKDDMGNTTTRTFIIDKTLDYEVIDSSGTSSVGSDMTTSGNVVINDNESLNIEVRKDGEGYPYSFGDVLAEEGKYEIRIYDEIGNSSSFTIVIDKSVDYSSNVEDGMTTNGDVWFVNGEKSTIIVTKDGKSYPYSWGEKMTGEGDYVVRMYDSYGNEKTVSFTIDRSVDFVSSVKDGESTNGSVTISANEDVDVSVTKDGETIDYRLGDALTDDGHYTVTVKDRFGNEETLSFEIDTTAPEITINGIEDGGKGDAKVTLTDMTEEGEIHVYKDGTEIEYELGQELSDYGRYEIVVTDRLGNSRTYSFELAFHANGAVIALVCIGVALIAGAVVLIVKRKKRVFKK